jgi:nucleotide-binding universal stress UspA family protein
VLLRAAEELHCDLIVMGTHGRTGLSRVLMDSLTEAVLRRDGCPILMIKASAAVVAKKMPRWRHQ